MKTSTELVWKEQPAYTKEDFKEHFTFPLGQEKPPKGLALFPPIAVMAEGQTGHLGETSAT